MASLTVIIPSRNELFLAPTVRDVLAKATGDTDVMVVLDGGVLKEPLPDDKRVSILSMPMAIGMRPCLNAAVPLATGTFIMKLDGHCMVSEGFDEVLTAQCDDDWVVIPRRERLDAERWAIEDVGKPPIDAHYLAYPFERPDDPECGLHGTPWPVRAAKRTHALLDDELSTQGSAWLFKKTFWKTLGPLERENYGSNIQESTEWGLRCWLSGGQMKVNKRAWYAHLHKGDKHGRGYVVSKREHRAGAAYCSWFWMTEQPFPGKTRSLRSLIEQFWGQSGLAVPTWPKDAHGALNWDEVERATATFMARYRRHA